LRTAACLRFEQSLSRSPFTSFIARFWLAAQEIDSKALRDYKRTSRNLAMLEISATAHVMGHPSKERES
jgi:hypothetical protein